jgi:hypothetical protein
MQSSPENDNPGVAAAFLARYYADQRRGSVKTLSEYQAAFCGQVLRRAHRSHLAFATVLSFAVAGCENKRGEARALLSEITSSLGINDSPGEWPDGQYRLPEIFPTGIALFDFDGDGDLDVYQVCHPLPDKPGVSAPNRLHKQTNGSFADVASVAGVDHGGYGTAVAIGDLDNDGDQDMYVSNVDADVLYLNNGDGTFSDISARAGIRGKHFSTSAAFLDFDRDGHLDLYVCHYVLDDPSKVCRPGADKRREYCGPGYYRGVTDTLYRNTGSGTFTDVSESAGLEQAWPGLGVVCVDLTGDGWVDIYVANDKKPNQLYVNQRNGTFRDEALERGVALNGSGNAEASMGVSVGDVNADGKLDIFLTHLNQETNTLYVQSGGSRNGHFMDRSASSRLGGPSIPYTGWGCGFVDLDHDGDLDIASVNGRIARGSVHADANVGKFWNDYAERNQLFLNDGGGQFREVPFGSGPFTSSVEVTRGLALGDIDRDGDLDFVTGNIDNGLRVFRNDTPPSGKTSGNHWLRVRALTRKRAALGALVTIQAGGRRQVRPLISAYSYCCANEPVAHFGLGTTRRVDDISVLWPDGTVEHFGPAAADEEVTVRRGISVISHH